MAVAGPRVTAASAFFMNELVKMEPGTEDSGIYASKPGYHNSRAGNIALDKTDNSSVPDYSIRLNLDLQGPSDKAAGYDWTHEKAHSGNYASMAKYGARLLAAFNARDPRLYGWREALGQTDTDATPEGLDFVYWTKRTPDWTHSWHWHLSELRAFVESMINKQCMLSVLRGESLAAYLARGGKLLNGAVAPGEDDDVKPAQAYQIHVNTYRTEATNACRNPVVVPEFEFRDDAGKLHTFPGFTEENKLATQLDNMAKALAALVVAPGTGASAEDIADAVVDEMADRMTDDV
jgi:hypothetical protein